MKKNNQYRQKPIKTNKKPIVEKYEKNVSKPLNLNLFSENFIYEPFNIFKPMGTINFMIMFKDIRRNRNYEKSLQKFKIMKTRGIEVIKPIVGK